MLKYHEEIERGYSHWDEDNSKERLTLDVIINSEEYLFFFDEMDWDQAYDRYTDMPEYDPFLKDARRLHYLRSLDLSEEGIKQHFGSYLQRYERVRKFQEENAQVFEHLCEGQIRLKSIFIPK